MQLQPHLAQVSDHLEAAAALGDERTREIATGLANAAAPAVRLALLGALSEAADEITTELLEVPGSPVVTVRLDGGDAVVDVRVAETAASDEPAPEPRRDDGEPSARISLRLAESLKSDVDAAAARDGVSVNTWLVRAADAALRPAGQTDQRGQGWQRNNTSNQRVTGWING
jgi:hypothetical protein